MSLHYLLDGYNIIKQTPSLNRGTLENQRLALINWIQICRPQGSVNNSVTIIFDGKDEFFGSHVTSSVKVIFSKGRQSADDIIKKIIEQASLKKSWAVVSDDKDIKFYVRALGANVLSVREFTKVSKVGEGFKSSRAVYKHGAQASKYISLTNQVKITKELERIWITPTGNPRQDPPKAGQEGKK